MKNYLPILTLFTLLIIGVSCKNDDYDNIPADVQVQNFVWKGLNAYYYWQQDMPDLSDQRFSSQEQLNSFLSDYPDPEFLFYSLLNDYPNTDRFSWIVDDYLALDDLLQEGISGSNGVEFGLVYTADCTGGVCGDIYGYVRYIIPNSDASTKNIQRGDIFHAVDGTPLTTSNYYDLLYASESYTLNLADYNAGNPTSNGESVSLTKSELQENPIYTTQTFDEGSKKIGYLMYNAFTPAFDNELNDVFSSFKNDGVTDLVLDLRYNPGGSIRTSSYLASMVTGQFTDELYIKEQWNDKWQNYFTGSDPDRIIVDFVDQINGGGAINSLNLDNVVILMTYGSASASELIINGLNPYINVTTIGAKTRGKVVGSLTLYDSANYGRAGANPNHTWAMQPIVLETKNKIDENEPEGFVPIIPLPEDYGNLGVLGDATEPLLERAIMFITTGSRPSFIDPTIIFENNEFSDSREHSLTGSNMYVELP